MDLRRDGLQTNLSQLMEFIAEDKTLELLWRGWSTEKEMPRSLHTEKHIAFYLRSGHSFATVSNQHTYLSQE